MERLIEKSLESLMDVNLHSAAGRQAVVKEIMKRIRDPKHPYFLNVATIDDKIPGYWDEKEKEKTVLEGCSAALAETAVPGEGLTGTVHRGQNKKSGEDPECNGTVCPGDISHHAGSPLWVS